MEIKKTNISKIQKQMKMQTQAPVKKAKKETGMPRDRVKFPAKKVKPGR